MHHREERVAAAIKEAVAEIVLNEMSDPGIGFVTVTRCRVSRDLKHAVVYFSILGDEAARNAGIKHLQHATGFIRRLVGQRVKLRYVPTLRLTLDEMLEHEQKVGEILHELFPEDSRGPADLEPPDPARKDDLPYPSTESECAES